MLTEQMSGAMASLLSSREAELFSFVRQAGESLTDENQALFHSPALCLYVLACTLVAVLVLCLPAVRHASWWFTLTSRATQRKQSRSSSIGGNKDQKSWSLQDLPMAWSLPWIGNLSLLFGLPHLMVTRLSQKYGKIFRLYAGGNRRFVLISDIDLVRDAMRRFPSALTGKPTTTTTEMTNAGAQRDMGKRWARRRQITMTAIKNVFREVPDVVQETCDSELSRLVQTVTDMASGSHDPTQNLTNFVARSMWRLVYGRGQEPDEKTSQDLKTLAKKIDHYTQNCGPFCLLDRFPKLKTLVSTAAAKYRDAVNFMNNFCENNESKRKSNDDDTVSSSHSDIMGFLLKGADGLTPQDKDNLGLDKDLLCKGLGDLIRAGTESPSLLILWTCYTLARHPDVQAKMAAELGDLYDRRHGVTISKVTLQDLPYTHAVVYETIRYCSLVPFLKRRTLDTVNVGGYQLPAGTDIIINNHAISHDVTRWGDPECFRPERFLATDASFDKSRLEDFLPFGIGKRRCLGEELGKLIPFAGVATLVHNFDIVQPQSDHGTPEAPPQFGITLTPPSFRVAFHSRHSTETLVRSKINNCNEHHSHRKCPSSAVL